MPDLARKGGEGMFELFTDQARQVVTLAQDEARMPHADWLDGLMTLPVNIASRCPVLSVPSGQSRDGVPAGLSIVGQTYDGVSVLTIAAAHEERFGWLYSPGHRPAL